MKALQEAQEKDFILWNSTDMCNIIGMTSIYA